MSGNPGTPKSNAKSKDLLFSTESENGKTPLETIFWATVAKNLNPEYTLAQGGKQICHFIELNHVAADVLRIAEVVGFGMHKEVVYREVQMNEYSDFIDLDPWETKNPSDRVAILGARCAGAWNALVRNAKMKGGSDPVTGETTQVFMPKLTSTLKFNVVDASSSVIDPLELSKGWAAYRFRFAYILVEKQ